MTRSHRWLQSGVLWACRRKILKLVAHRFWLLSGANARRELTTALEHLAIVAGSSSLLSLMSPSNQWVKIVLYR